MAECGCFVATPAVPGRGPEPGAAGPRRSLEKEPATEEFAKSR